MKRGIREEIKERALLAADYIISTHCTRLECSRALDIPLTLIDKDIRYRLEQLDHDKYEQVMKIGEENKYRRTSEKTLYMLDFFTLEIIDKYVSIAEAAEDLMITRSCLLKAFRENKNGIYFSKPKELFLMTKEAYEKIAIGG